MAPLYKAVKHKLTEELRTGRWRHGQAIPSEPVLANRYAVSVGTLRRAVGELVAENILVREQGRGTFVASHTRDYMLNVFFRIEDREGRRALPDSELLSFRLGRANRATAAALQIAIGDPVFQIRARLRLQGKAVILDDIRLPARLFPDLNERLFVDRDTTIYGMFQARYGITVARTTEVLTAQLADKLTCRLLDLQTPAAVLKVVRTAYAYKDLPVDWRMRYVNTRSHHYLSVLGGP
ncbi:MAG TPA: GntR family transcriptional regulator [Burkholderiales bacterium]|nr:GntR family transcriptional regulator [Burkholderiales bacterium]